MRSAWGLVFASVAVSLGAAWACLPDLEIGATRAFCGDGIVDPDAGEECDPGDAAATSSVCPGCRVQCAGGSLPFVDPASYHCYFSALVQERALATSGAACEDAGAHVVRFVSEKEVALVMNDAPSDFFWVGLERQGSATWLPSEPTSEPGWTPACTGCFAHEDAGAADIAPDPTNPDGGENCISSSKVFARPWTQSLCRAVARVTICEREPVGTRTRPCGGDGCITVAATQGRKRYVLLDRKLGANDAALACAAAGGRLVVLESREEREQLGQEIGVQSLDRGAHDFWIGLSTDPQGTWRWEAPGGMAPLPWGLSQPAAVASGSGRAYVSVAVGVIDSELARAGDAADGGSSEEHYAVCEL